MEQLSEESRLSDRIFAPAQSHPTALSVICVFGLDRLWTSVEITNEFDWNQWLGSWDETLLHIATRERHVEVVKLLLAQKTIHVDPKDSDGRTPLSWAAENGHEVVVELLLEKDAELESKGRDGRTPLSWAAESGREAVVELLLEEGAELESKDKDGRTPLSWAAESGREAVMKLLSINQHSILMA
jgi:ankyrin repeat protein